MDFSAVVERAKLLHEDGLTPADGDAPNNVIDAIYGRVCSSESRNCPPTELTSTPGRKTAFVFGPDAITSVILSLGSYEAIRSLGFTREYIKHEVFAESGVATPLLS